MKSDILFIVDELDAPPSKDLCREIITSLLSTVSGFSGSFRLGDITESQYKKHMQTIKGSITTHNEPNVRKARVNGSYVMSALPILLIEDLPSSNVLYSLE